MSDDRGWYGAAGIPVELTSFVGRKDLISQAIHLLQPGSLLTLAGPAGVGKTRVAQRVALQILGTASTARVYWVRFAALDLQADNAKIARAIADSMGLADVPERALLTALQAHLRNLELQRPGSNSLLVFDNCEHLTQRLGTMAQDLLCSAPNLRILATSRELLHCQIEQVLHVRPLSYDDEPNDDGAPARMVENESLELLLERAKAVGVAIPADRIPAASRVCRLLEGIPLAIELAAASLRSQSLDEIAAGLHSDDPDARLGLLSGGPRHGARSIHRSLSAALDWSYGLCGSAERALWLRLAVFEDGWDLEAAQAVCADEDIAAGDIPDLLRQLADKSIITLDPAVHVDTSPRYRMLETLRHYGLAIDPDQPNRRVQHLRYEHFRGRAAQARSDWFSPRHLSWVWWARVELSNLRSALNWGLHTAGEEETALAMAVDLAGLRIASVLRSPREALSWLEQALDLTAEHGDTTLRFQAMALASANALAVGATDRAALLLAQCRERSAPDFPASLLHADGVAVFFKEGSARAVTILDSALAKFDSDGMRRHGERFLTLLAKAMAAAWYCDDSTADATTRQLIDDALASGSHWAISRARWVRGLAFMWHGDPATGLALEREVIRAQHNADDYWGLVWSIHAVAWAHAELLLGYRDQADLEQDTAEHCARILGGAQSLHERSHITLADPGPQARWPERGPFARAITNARNRAKHVLGEERYSLALTEGRQLDRESVIHLALTETVPQSTLRHFSTTTSPDQGQWGSLTHTERKVACLAAKGESNQEIAQRQGASVRTVEKHLQAVYRKLGINKRDQIQIWITRFSAGAQ